MSIKYSDSIVSFDSNSIRPEFQNDFDWQIFAFDWLTGLDNGHSALDFQLHCILVQFIFLVLHFVKSQRSNCKTFEKLSIDKFGKTSRSNRSKTVRVILNSVTWKATTIHSFLQIWNVQVNFYSKTTQSTLKFNFNFMVFFSSNWKSPLKFAIIRISKHQRPHFHFSPNSIFQNTIQNISMESINRIDSVNIYWMDCFPFKRFHFV